MIITRVQKLGQGSVRYRFTPVVIFVDHRVDNKQATAESHLQSEDKNQDVGKDIWATSAQCFCHPYIPPLLQFRFVMPCHKSCLGCVSLL